MPKSIFCICFNSSFVRLRLLYGISYENNEKWREDNRYDRTMCFNIQSQLRNQSKSLIFFIYPHKISIINQIRTFLKKYPSIFCKLLLQKFDQTATADVVPWSRLLHMRLVLFWIDVSIWAWFWIDLTKNSSPN